MYALIGLAAGVLWLLIAAVGGYEDVDPRLTLVVMTVGGALGGQFRKSMGKTR